MCCFAERAHDGSTKKGRSDERDAAVEIVTGSLRFDVQGGLKAPDLILAGDALRHGWPAIDGLTGYMYK